MKYPRDFDGVLFHLIDRDVGRWRKCKLARPLMRRLVIEVIEEAKKQGQRQLKCFAQSTTPPQLRGLFRTVDMTRPVIAPRMLAAQAAADRCTGSDITPQDYRRAFWTAASFTREAIR